MSIKVYTKKKKRRIFASVIILLLLFSALFTYGPHKIWQKLIKYSDVNASAVREVNLNEAAEKDLSVHFINVDQGDCTLIKYGEYNILIDCAKSVFQQNVYNYLKALNVNHLTLVIATHPDSDHIGGFPFVLSKVKCDKLVMPMLPTSFKKSSGELKLISTLKTYKIKSEYAKNEKEYTFGALKLKTYITDKSHEDENDYSVLTKAIYKNASFLFTGDVGKGVEQELINKGINLSADILKAAHHGSNKSTSDAFIAYVKPSIAVFSCGYNNEYGHPHADVISRLNKFGVKFFRTDYNGDIVIGTDGEIYYTAVQKS